MARKKRTDAVLVEGNGSEQSELVTTVETSLIDKQLDDLENQFKALADQLQKLETEFNEKKQWALTTLEQLRGGIFALRGLKEGQTAGTPVGSAE